MIFIKLISVLFATQLGITAGSRILFIGPVQARSHRLSMYPLGQALAQRGHEVHFWGETLKEKGKPPEGITDTQIEVEGMDPEWVRGVVNMNSSLMLHFQWKGETNTFSILSSLPIFYLDGMICRHFLSHDQVGQFWKFAGQKWDLILLDELFQNCGHAMALNPKQINTTLALVQTATVDFTIAYLGGYGFHPAAIPPTITKPLDWDPKFFRCRLDSTIEVLFGNLGLFWIANAMVNYHITPAKPVLSMFDNYRRSSMLLYDFPDVLDWPKPKMHDLLPYGSNCFGTPKPLPDELEAFVNDTTSKGTILVAFGTIVKLNTAPKHVQEALISGLSQLTEYRIIWAYSGGSAPQVPSHIKILPWLPQFDILSDARTKVFLSHGGLKSFKESVCAETPVVFMPLLGDQPRNAYLGKNKGFGDFVYKQTVTSTELAEKLRNVAENPEFHIKIRKLKAQMTDRVIPILDEAAHWVEQTLKQGHSPKIWRPKSRDLFWFQFWCIDIILLFLSASFFFIFATISVIRKFISKSK